VAALTADDTELGKLSASFEGDLVMVGDPTYEEHRKVWNGSIDRFPTLIARCRGVADVMAAVKFARSAGLPVAVRGGGHSYPGHSVCDNGIVIDLGPMKGTWVDTEARTARIQAGVPWGDLDRETQAFGLATTGVFVSHTGVAGLTLGGGIGSLHRMHGLTIDPLLAVDLITPRASSSRRARRRTPTFGACEGGGNFGIVTEFEFRLHDVARSSSRGRSTGRWRKRRLSCASTGSGPPRRRTS